jgi:hypothetical protein
MQFFLGHILTVQADNHLINVLLCDLFCEIEKLEHLKLMVLTN